MTRSGPFLSDALAGRVAIVTGAGGGIGRAIVEAFRGAGAQVAATDLTAPAMASAEVIALLHDVASPEDWARVVEQTLTRFGRVNLLVNCAGVFRPALIAEETVENFLLTVQVNQLGVLLGMQSVLDPMKAAGGGSIINLSSGAGLYGNAGTVSYAATKFAVRGMTKVAAIEFAPFGIRVNSIHPAAVRTSMVINLMEPEQAGHGTLLKRIMEPEEVANMALFLASDASSYSTGVEFICDGGISA
jgi:3alpha(or 20beta)-hydroxysteroid dehydrogenase